jgi:prepilin-type N-terminal cleavage/methylation domain-containing protein
MRKGFTLAECMVAGAVLCLLSLALLQGIPMVTRIANENAQLLAADSLAWDAAWKTFNVPYANLPEYNTSALTTDRTALNCNVSTKKTTWTRSSCTVYELPKSAAPDLWIENSPALLMIAIAKTPETNDVVLTDKMGLEAHNEEFPQHKRIWVDVEWGADENRHRLSDYHTLFVDRSGRSRIPWEVQQ